MLNSLFFPLKLCSVSFSTEHDTRILAKERQKKDNHNLSKMLSLHIRMCLGVCASCVVTIVIFSFDS